MQVTPAVTKLIESIDSAFANRTDLAVEDLVYQGSWETETLITDLSSVNGIPDDAFVERHADALPEFTPEGLCQVVPCYLRYSLTHGNSEVGITVRDNLLYHFADDSSDTDYWRVRFRCFSENRRHVICDYLRYLESYLREQTWYSEYLARGLAKWCSSNRA